MLLVSTSVLIADLRRCWRPSATLLDLWTQLRGAGRTWPEEDLPVSLLNGPYLGVFTYGWVPEVKIRQRAAAPSATYDVLVTYRTNAADGRGLSVGVLALQGDVREHLRILEEMGAAAVPVRRPAELDAVDGLIIPGGESTTIDRLARVFALAEPLKQRIAEGMPVYGSCAGMILLADEIAEPARNAAGEPQQSFGGLDMTVRRNAFGRQRESFETDLEFAQLEGEDAPPSTVHAVFIRAPWVERAGAGVQVLASIEPGAEPSVGPGAGTPPGHRLAQEARIVAVRSSNKLATSFHPEVTGERRIHELFIRMIRGEA